MRIVRYLTMLTALAVSSGSIASGLPGLEAPRFLPVDEAFQLTADLQGDDVVVRWFSMPGYYLYRKSLVFESRDVDVDAAVIPEGELKEDEYFGEVQVYFDELLVQLPLLKGRKSASVAVRYQGCAAAGYCYPPQKRVLRVPDD